MQLRKKINENRWIAVLVAVVVTGIAAYQVYSELAAAQGGRFNTAFYTNDDGKTFFADSNDLIVPFDRDGKECVMAHVFECDGKQIVGYLAKMTPAAKIATETYRADVKQSPNARPTSGAAADAASANGWLYKYPGDREWKPGGAQTRLPVKCADGKAAVEVMAP